MYVCIYLFRERERHTHIVYIYMYIYIYIYIYMKGRLRGPGAHGAVAALLQGRGAAPADARQSTRS